MSTLTYRTAGESHGPGLIALIEGMPHGCPIDAELINRELQRRQGGYGRGGRQKIETDRVQFIAGIRMGKTIGSPIAILVPNKDNRLDDPAATPPLHRPRPGHADLAGAVKWLTDDCREVLERASARETTVRVAAGGLAKCLLLEFGIEVFGFVRQVGDQATDMLILHEHLADLLAARDGSEVYCPDPAADARMKDFINQQKIAKDTAGGIVESHVIGFPVGIGIFLTWDGRLDSRIAAAVVGIQAFKGVEIGLGFEAAKRPGSQVHDEIGFDAAKVQTPSLGYVRRTNNAGGLEGGMTNGQPVVVRGAMKPISTLGKPLRSIDLRTKEPSEAGWERSDISAISAAGVVMENVIAFEIARAMIEKFAGDSLPEMRQNYQSYLAAARKLGEP